MMKSRRSRIIGYAWILGSILMLQATSGKAQETDAAAEPNEATADAQPFPVDEKPSSSALAISLSEAVNRAVTRNPQVDQAQAELDAKTEKKRGAWSNLGPRVSAQYNETYFGDKLQTTGDNPILIRDDNAKTGSVTISQPLTGIYAGVQYGRLSGLEADLSYEGLRQTKRDVGFQAAEAFLNAYQAQQQSTIAQASLLAARRQHEDALAIQRVGRLSQGDVLKFQLALSQAESRSAQAEATYQMALATLRQVMQTRDDEDFSLEKSLPELQTSDLALKKGIEEALAKRPEVKKAELANDLADFSKDIAYAQFIPDISLFKRWDRNLSENTGFGSQKETVSYGLSLKWDIWSNGSSVFATREAFANKRKAEATKVSAIDAIKLDVMQAWQNFQAAKQSLQFAQTGVKQAEEAYRIDQTRFKNGQISATDLIFSESAKTSAQGNKAAAETQYLLWHFRLQRSTGQELPKLTTAS